MKNKNKKGIEPKLRFPEFRNTAIWKKEPLEKFLDYQQPTPYLVADTRYSDEYEIPVVTAGKKFLLGYTNEKQGVFMDSLPVIIFDDFTTATQFVDFPFKAKSSAMKILKEKKGVNIKFMYETLQMISYEVGTHERHWISKFTLMQVPMPTDPKEQQKIAYCLSSLDELIEMENQKLKALQRHKKGLMQELFPAEGQTLPKRRFSKFQTAPKWRERKTETLFSNRAENGEEWLPIYSVTTNNGLVKRSSLERKIDDIAESSGNKKVCKDDIAYNMMRMWQGAFGVSKEDCMVSPAYVVLSPKRDVCSDFFWYLFKMPKYLQLLTSHSQGLTMDRLRLYYKDFAQISVLIPTFPEQQRIAEFLSSIDDLITIQSQKLTALRDHKKGLTQQLFPNASEVEE